MQITLVDGERREAEPGLSGKCPGCGATMVARCGRIRVWHWAHRGKRHCDHWWEPETEWHRDWKNQFPREWREIIHRADDGEKHIADVKTEHGLVLEFQHSRLPPEEREAREAFYQKMFWVVDSHRRKRDWPRFSETLDEAMSCWRRVVRGKPLTLSIPSYEGALIRDWAGSSVPVFFDFRGPNNLDLQGNISLKEVFRFQILWSLHPKSPDGWVHVIPVWRADFVEAVLKGAPLKGIDFSNQLERARKANALEHRRIFAPADSSVLHRPWRRVIGSWEHMARNRRARSRRRL